MSLVWRMLLHAAQEVLRRLGVLIFWVFVDAAERHELRVRQRCGFWRYLELMGPALWMPRAGQRMFQWGLRRCARRARVADLLELLDSGWRERLVVSWLIAAGCRSELRPRIVQDLSDPGPLESLYLLCLALVCFGTEQDARVLSDYLIISLALPEEPDDGWQWHCQAGAMAALLYLDQCLGTRHAAPILAADGPWERWPGSSRVVLEDELRDLAGLVAFARGEDPGPW